MAKVHFVKKARKDNMVCKKGESYHWWQPYGRSVQYSKNYPKGSQLCSGKKSSILAAQENIEVVLSALSHALEKIKGSTVDCGIPED